MSERITISVALIFIKHKSGYDFERKTFTRWLEGGSIAVNGKEVAIDARQVEGRWFISRTSIERLIEALTQT